jgi:hypothetical protein
MSMTFSDRIAKIYSAHGPRHLLPFVGQSYENASCGVFRVAVVGINAYLCGDDWHKPGKVLRTWYRNWWEDAGHGETHRYFNVAYREVNLLAGELTSRSKLFSDLRYDAKPQDKSGIYGTNFIKELLEEKYKDSRQLTEAQVQQSKPGWRHELDLMAEHRVLPHLVIVLGQKMWGAICESFDPECAQTNNYQHLQTAQYKTCFNPGDPCYHHANLLTLRAGETSQKLLLVRMDHPSARRQRRALWLLTQPHFRKLARLP